MPRQERQDGAAPSIAIAAPRASLRSIVVERPGTARAAIYSSDG